jgi:hypothetical protein
MPNFSSPVSTQTDLEFFFDIFSIKFQNFSKELLSEFQNNPNLICCFMLQLSKHFHAKFKLSSFYPDGLFLTFFQESFRIFQKNSQTKFKIIQILVNCLMLQLSKHVHTKFQLSSFYPDGLRQIFDHFSSKFQNFLEKISKFSDSEKSSK